jgi:hypothetical protein|tara:strand:+ start:2764 stop:3444 length:681 start_codon:yes stop_codon:yes gene_type:complete
MTDLLDKFKNLCTTNVILPDSNEITLNKLNVNFQTKLHSHFTNLPNDSENIDNVFVLEYIKFINKHIIELHSERTFTHRDKLFLLDFWKNDIESSDNSSNILEDLKCIDKLNDVELKLNLGTMHPKIKFKQPTLQQENTILTFLLENSNSKNTDMDIIFFDVFRFLHSIDIDDHQYLIDNITTQELYELFLLFDIEHLRTISKTLSETLEKVTNIRLLEADYSSFY